MQSGDWNPPTVAPSLIHSRQCCVYVLDWGLSRLSDVERKPHCKQMQSRDQPFPAVRAAEQEHCERMDSKDYSGVIVSQSDCCPDITLSLANAIQL